MVTEKQKKNLEKRVKIKKGTARKMQALSVASRAKEKNLLKAMEIWIKEGRFVEEVDRALSDEKERKIVLPILLKKALPDNINLTADAKITGGVVVLDREIVRAKPIEGVND